VHAERLAFLADPQALLPELVERRVAGAEALVAEALAVVADLGVGVTLDQRLDLGLQVGGGLLLLAVEEEVPLHLQLTHRHVEAVEVVREGHALRLASGEDPEEGQPQLVGVGHLLPVHEHLSARAPPDELEQLPQRARLARVEVRAVDRPEGARLLAVHGRPPRGGHRLLVPRALERAEADADAEGPGRRPG
jgi:hypothetical protein